MAILALPKYALNGKRVLLVEDEALVAMMIEDELLGAGAHIVGTASSVAEALRMIEAAMGAGGISVAILDLNLDGEAIWPVADALDRLGVPFVIETGYGPAFDARKYVMAPVLHKPFDPQALIHAVEDLVTPSR